METDVAAFEQALLVMNRQQAWEIMGERLKGMAPVAFVESVMVPALEHIGEGWETGAVSLSQVYMSGRMCEELIYDILPPADVPKKDHPRIGLAVLEDYHMLGKRLVSSVLTANRIQPVDYGRVETADLLQRVQQDNIEVLLISTLMLPSALQIRNVVDLLTEKGLNVPVIAGGAPFRLDRNLWQEVRADATADRASDVVRAIHQVTGGRL